jgi:hypothetical protein
MEYKSSYPCTCSYMNGRIGYQCAWCLYVLCVYTSVYIGKSYRWVSTYVMIRLQIYIIFVLWWWWLIHQNYACAHAWWLWADNMHNEGGNHAEIIMTPVLCRETTRTNDHINMYVYSYIHIFMMMLHDYDLRIERKHNANCCLYAMILQW